MIREIKPLIRDIYHALADRPTRRRITEVARAALPSLSLLVKRAGKAVDLFQAFTRIEGAYWIVRYSRHWIRPAAETSLKTSKFVSKWFKWRYASLAAEVGLMGYDLLVKPISLFTGASLLSLAASATGRQDVKTAADTAFTLLGYRRLGKSFRKGRIVGGGKLAVSAIRTYQLACSLFDLWAEKLAEALMPR